MIRPFPLYDGPNSDNPNVIDFYKTWLKEQIRADLDKKRSDMIAVFQNIEHDFNIASAIRSFNFFLGKEIYVFPKRKFNRRGCVGVHTLEHIYSADCLEEVVKPLKQDGYMIFAIENTEKFNPHSMYDVEFPKKSCFVFGAEGPGLGENDIKLCDSCIYIPGNGSVRSINVANCATVVFAEYCRRRMI